MSFMRKVGSLLSQSLLKNAASASTGLSSKPSIFNAVRYMSSSKLFVGGLSWSTDEEALRQAFSQFGQVVEARVILERETGRSRGFGFVTFGSPEESGAALQQMHGTELQGRAIRVEYATDRPRGFGGGGFGGGPGGFAGGGYGRGPYTPAGYNTPQYAGNYSGGSADGGSVGYPANSVNNYGWGNGNPVNQNEFGQARNSDFSYNAPGAGGYYNAPGTGHGYNAPPYDGNYSGGSAIDGNVGYGANSVNEYGSGPGNSANYNEFGRGRGSEFDYKAPEAGGGYTTSEFEGNHGGESVADEIGDDGANSINDDGWEEGNSANYNEFGRGRGSEFDYKAPEAGGGYTTSEFEGNHGGESVADEIGDDGANSINDDGWEEGNSANNSEFGGARDSENNGNGDSCASGAGEGKH